jgi:hypothetical protein
MCLSLDWFRREIKRKRNFQRFYECSCDICGKNFENMEKLITHMGVHSTEQMNRLLKHGFGTVRCNKCFTSFTSVAAMEEHPCIHSNSVIDGLSPIPSCDSLESVLIHPG